MTTKKGIHLHRVGNMPQIVSDDTGGAKDDNRMDRIICEQLFALLRAGLWGEKAETAPFTNITDADWCTLLHQIRAQVVIGIAYDGMETLPERLQPPRAIHLQWSDSVARIEMTHAQQNRMIHEVTRMYQAAGIVPVVLKGQGIATHYAHPQRRQCEDIDIYVSPHHYRLANELLAAHGATPTDEATQTHASYHYRGVRIRNHRLIGSLNNPHANRHFQQSVCRWYPQQPALLTLHNSAATGEQAAECTVLTPPVEFNRTYLLQHAFTHFLHRGIDIRHLCDWSRLLYATRHQPTDRVATDGQLMELGLMNAAQAFAYLAVEYLRLSVEMLPFSYNKEVAAPLGQQLLNDIWCTRYPTRATHSCRELRRFAPTEARWHTVMQVQNTLTTEWHKLLTQLRRHWAGGSE